jgi:hypothetical protein
MYTPRLKTLFCGSRGDQLAVSIDQRRVVELCDPDRRVRRLLELALLEVPQDDGLTPAAPRPGARVRSASRLQPAGYAGAGTSLIVRRRDDHKQRWLCGRVAGSPP